MFLAPLLVFFVSITTLIYNPSAGKMMDMKMMKKMGKSMFLINYVNFNLVSSLYCILECRLNCRFNENYHWSSVLSYISFNDSRTSSQGGIYGW